MDAKVRVFMIISTEEKTREIKKQCQMLFTKEKENLDPLGTDKSENY